MAIRRVNPGAAAAIGVGVRMPRSNASHLVSALQGEAAQKQQNISRLNEASQNLIAGATKAVRTVADVEMNEQLAAQNEARKRHEEQKQKEAIAAAQAAREQAAIDAQEAKLKEARFATDFKKTAAFAGNMFDRMWQSEIGLKIGSGGYQTEEEVVQKTIELVDKVAMLSTEEAFNGAGTINFRDQATNRARLPGMLKEQMLFSATENAKKAFYEWTQKDTMTRATGALDTIAQAGTFDEGIIRSVCNSEIEELSQYMTSEQIGALVKATAEKGALTYLNAESQKIMKLYTESAYDLLNTYLQQEFSLEHAKKLVWEDAQSSIPGIIENGWDKSLRDAIAKLPAGTKEKIINNNLTLFKKQLDTIELESEEFLFEDLTVALNPASGTTGQYPQTRAFVDALNMGSVYGQKDEKTSTPLSPIRNEEEAHRAYVHFSSDLAELDMSKAKDRRFALSILKSAALLPLAKQDALKTQFREMVKWAQNPRSIEDNSLKATIENVFNSYDDLRGFQFNSSKGNNNPDVKSLANTCLALIRKNPQQAETIIKNEIAQRRIVWRTTSEGNQIARSMLNAFVGADTHIEYLDLLNRRILIHEEKKSPPPRK